MKKLFAAPLALALMLAAAPALGQVVTYKDYAPSGDRITREARGPFAEAVATDRGGTITTGGTAQSAMAANTFRKGWCVQNDPAASETLYVRADGTASATAGTALQAGQQVCNATGTVTTGVISVFGATTAHRFYATELQ